MVGNRKVAPLRLRVEVMADKYPFGNLWVSGRDEYAYVAPDPKDPNIIYGGRVIKFDKRTGQSQVVAPEVLRSGKIRFIRTMPLLFHPADDNMLLFGTNIVFKTMDGGQSWEEISPDLTRKQPEVPSSVGDFLSDEMKTMPQRAIVYALGPSHLNKNIIWAGTDDGLVISQLMAEKLGTMSPRPK